MIPGFENTMNQLHALTVRGDLISRADAIKAIENLQNCYNGYSDTYDKAYIIGVLEELPSAEPDVIRCKDCKYCRKEDEYEYWCYGFCSPARLVRKDDFCSYGCKYE